MGYAKRTLAAALGLSLAIAAPAAAGEVIVVDGKRATRVDDPAVPSRAEIALGAPEGGRAIPELAGALSARAARSDRRKARAWSTARGAAGGRTARRAV